MTLNDSSPLYTPAKARLKGALPPGARIHVRGEEWLVRTCQYDTELASWIVTAEGATGVARGVPMAFLDALDRIEIVDPLDVKFEADESPNYRRTKLLIDLWIKKSVPSTNDLVIGHKGAFQPEPYQRLGAFKALDSTTHLRPRILLADAVGLGKTLQVGILLSELIRRGKGQRILVVCLRSMLTQFQKEMWSRFSIPLRMMDRERVERVFREIPSRMNPFNYHDKTIISMDTLKSDWLMSYLDTANWDVIVIDECHNVARRGSRGNMRSRLARKLSAASNSLILTSATPHDGSPESYASLLELIDPLLVTNPRLVTKKDLEHVVIRRFHKDLQLSKKIPPRKEFPNWVLMSPIEEAVLMKLRGKVFKILDQNKKRHHDIFFRSTLAKTLYSSPEAIVSSLEERIKKIDVSQGDLYREDFEFLSEIHDDLKGYSIGKTQKYKALLKTIKEEIGKKDRVVIFTEFRKTQDALIRALSADLSLKTSEDSKSFDKSAQIVTFNASVPEDTQQEIIESFGAQNSKIKVLVTTDIASEGVNLHYFCHNLVHYDVPWSLITLEQRNGRIDRYGQEYEPRIYYFVGDSKISELEKLKERWVVEKLLERSRTARDQLGDESLAMGCFDPDKEIEKVTLVAQEGEPLENAFLNHALDDLFGPVNAGSTDEAKTAEIKTLFNEVDFVKNAFKELKVGHTFQEGVFEVGFELGANRREVMLQSLQSLSRELDLNETTKVLSLSHNTSLVQNSITEARKKAGEWPSIHHAWELHPLFQVLNRILENTFDKTTVPTVHLNVPVLKNTAAFLLYGSTFNRRGQPVTSELTLCYEESGKWVYRDAFAVFEEFGFARGNVVNPGSPVSIAKAKKLHEQAKTAIEQYHQSLCAKALRERNQRLPLLEKHHAELDRWHVDRSAYLKKELSSPQQKRRLEEEIKASDRIKVNFEKYVSEQYEIDEKHPYTRLVAAFIGGAS